MASDYEINARVRAVLTRHWVSLQELTVASSNRVAHLRGIIRYQPSKEMVLGEIDAGFLLKLEQELRRVKDLKGLRWNLENWHRDELGWTPLRRPAKPTPPKPEKDSAAATAEAEERRD